MTNNINTSRISRNLYDLQAEIQEKMPNFPKNNPSIKKIINRFFGGNPDILPIIKNHKGTFSSLVSKISQSGVNDKKIIALCVEILQTIEKPRETKPFSKAVPVEILFDIHTPDHNLAIFEDFLTAIENKHPVIVSRQIIKASRSTRKETFPLCRIHDKFKKIIREYEIFAKGAFLVFVPKGFAAGTLDLQDSLDKVSLEDAWQISEEKPTFEDFKLLFNENPTHDKLFFINGHGGTGQPAGLNAEQYKNFLSWLEEQNCKILVVSSCHSGGESALLHLGNQDKSEEQQGVQFPVILRSIGDFPINSNQEAEEDTHSFLPNLVDLFESPGGRTVSRLRSLVQIEERGISKFPTNLIQVYFPHSGDSPGNFRPIGEGGKSFSLTYNQYRKFQIEKEEIAVKNRAFIELSPPLVESPIAVESGVPVLLSMIPGKANHILSQVKLDAASNSEFIKSNISFYEKTEIGVNKTIFIEALISGSEAWEQVFINLQSGHCGYIKDNGCCFLWNAKEADPPLPLTQFQYFLQHAKAMHKSWPAKEAIRRATGGQQGEEEIMQYQLRSWEARGRLAAKYLPFLDIKRLMKMSVEELKILIEDANLEHQEVASLVSYLLPINEKLACATFKIHKLPPDSKDEDAVPLFIQAAKLGRCAFVNLLIEEGVDVNIQDPTNLRKTAIALALANWDTPLIDILLEQKPLDLEARDAKGNPAFAAAIFDPDSLQKCLEKNPALNLNIIYTSSSNTKYSLLGLAIGYSSFESVQILLKNKADPNFLQGRFSPLSEAIISANKKKIDLLLEYDANPFLKDQNENYPIIEAIKRSSASLVEKLLKSYEEKTKNLSGKEKQALATEMFYAALASGEESKLRLVIDSGLGLSISQTSGSYIPCLYGLRFFIQLNKIDLLKEIFQILPKSANFGFSLTKYGLMTMVCLEENPLLILEFMDRTWNFPKLVNNIINQSNSVDLEVKRQIILKARELGYDLNRSSGNFLPLQQAINNRDFKLASVLIEAGANPSLAVEQILDNPDLEFIKFAYHNGLSQELRQPSFLAQVSSRLSDSRFWDIFQWLVEQNGDINEEYEESTPFLQAISSGNFDLYSICLPHGGMQALSNERMREQALIRAAQNGSEGSGLILKDLVEKRDADLNASGSGTGSTPFSFIAYYASMDLISWCIEKGAQINPLNPYDKMQPLYAAGIRQDSQARDVFKYLVSQGGALNESGYNEATPIIPIIEKGDVELLKFCFENGAAIKNKALVQMAFFSAFKSGNPEILTEIQNRGYSFSMLGLDESRTANVLAAAYQSGGSAMLAKALEFHPSSIGIVNAVGRLEGEMIFNNDLAAMIAFENKGYVFDVQNIFKKYGRSSLFSNKGEEVGFKLLSQLDRKDRIAYLEDYMTAFINGGLKKWLKFALDNGVDPNIEIANYREEWPLIFEMIDFQDLEMVRIVLDAKPDLSITHEGLTPLDYAILKGHRAIIKMLKAEKSR